MRPDPATALPECSEGPEAAQRFAAEFAALLSLLSKPDPVEHKPGGFLGDPKCPGDFATTDAVLAVALG